MKKSLIGAVSLLAGACAVHCQGVVSFENYGSLSPYIYVSLGSTLLGGSSIVTTGVPEMDVGNGNDWTVALYGNSGWNDAASNLIQLENWGGQPVMANLETNSQYDSTPGTWFYFSTTAVIPSNNSTNGYSATVQVRAWYNRGGQYNTYEAALAAAVPIGVSATVNMNDENPGTIEPPQQYVAAALPSGTGPGELGNIILSYPTNLLPSGPVLTMKLNGVQLGDSGSNSFSLSWPTNYNGFTLQSTTTAGSPMLWTNVSPAPTVVNGQNTVTNVMAGRQQFFRLANP